MNRTGAGKMKWYKRQTYQPLAKIRECGAAMVSKLPFVNGHVLAREMLYRPEDRPLA